MRARIPAIVVCICVVATSGADAEETLGTIAWQVVHRAQRGDYAAATPLAERAVEVVERQFGDDLVETATAVINLASLYAARGHGACAAPLYQRGLATLEKCLGPEHPDTARSWNALALARRAWGGWTWARGWPASQALRTAQLDFLEARRTRGGPAAAHPYFWAAYGTTGR